MSTLKPESHSKQKMKEVCILIFILKINIFAISSRGPRLWNKILDNNTKDFQPFSLFQKAIKNR